MSYEVAWAAGFFDGEGHSGLSGGYISISIAQTHPEVLERFRNAVEIGNVIGPHARKDNKGKPVWRYNAFSTKAEEAMERIYPFLSTEKRLQWDSAFKKAKVPRRSNYCHNNLHEMIEENTKLVLRKNNKEQRLCLACRLENSKRSSEVRKNKKIVFLP